MAAEYGFYAHPEYVVCANPSKIALMREFECETAAGMYPGRLVKKGSTDAEVVVNDTSDNSACIGFIGYEQASLDDRPDTIDTVWTVNKSVPIINGPGMVIRAYLCGGAANSVAIGQKLAAASYYGALDKYQCPAVGVNLVGQKHKNAVAIALETLDESAVPRTSGAALWVMSLI